MGTAIRLSLGFPEQRRRAAALQNLAKHSGLVPARQRLGRLQPSGALASDATKPGSMAPALRTPHQKMG